MIRLLTLGRGGIAGAVGGAVLGVVGLVVPVFWRSLQAAPVATIDSPAQDAHVPRCFVARGTVDPSTIRRPLWLIKQDAGEHWREVGRVYPPPGTWGSRVCASSNDVTEVRLALVLADDALDAKLSGPPVPEPETEIPLWLKRCPEDQGGCERRRGFSSSWPEGATAVASVTVSLPAIVRRSAYPSATHFGYLPIPALETDRPRHRRGRGTQSLVERNLRATLY